jgi:hypothetical protein
MKMPQLQITLIQQHWLEGSSPEQDVCSHGKIKLLIGGESIASGDEEYGVSESALALLRTLNQNHSIQEPVAERLIFHGCGTMLMMGCPIGIDFDVRHEHGHVRIGNVVRYDGTSNSDVVKFPEVAVELSEEEYRREVIAFANEARKSFAGVTKTFSDEFDRQEYEQFWREYDLLLNDCEIAAEQALAADSVERRNR